MAIEPDAVEHHPFDYDWIARLPALECVATGAGWSVYAGAAEGAWWIVRDAATLGDLDDEQARRPIAIERYDDEARWRAAVAQARSGG